MGEKPHKDVKDLIAWVCTAASKACFLAFIDNMTVEKKEDEFYSVHSYINGSV